MASDDMDEDDPQVDKQSSEVWFDDGNIVLRAKRTYFRAYKGILCRESRVFRDMFSFPQPEGSGETYGDSGCPVVEVQDDPWDMELFLMAIFDSRYLFQQCDLQDHTILLGICSKYQATSVLRRVMAVLEHFYPSTLSGRDHSVKRIDADHPKCATYADTALTHDDISDDNVKLLVQTASRAGMQILLPAAFLYSTIDSINYIFSDAYEGWSQADLRTLLTGQRKLYRIAREVVFPALFDGRRDIASNCHQPALCHNVRQSIIKEVEIDALGLLSPFVVLDPSDDLAELCAPCRKVLKESYQAGRAKAWEELPEQFGLPRWAELRKARDDALADTY